MNSMTGIRCGFADDVNASTVQLGLLDGTACRVVVPHEAIAQSFERSWRSDARRA